MATDDSIESAQSENNEQDVKTDETDASTVSDENTDVNTAADTSIAENVDENTPSDSSADEGDKKEEPTLEEMLEKSIDEVTKAQAEDSPSEEQSDQDTKDKEKSDTESKEQQKTEDEGTEPTEDDLSEEEEAASDEWRNNPATKKILSERKKARAERDEFKGQAEEFKQEAEQFRQIRDFLDKGGVSDDSAAQALKLAALWQNDPHSMFQQLEHMRNELGMQLGLVLPTDLQKEVNEGLISPERASELARARGNVQVAQQQVDQVSQQSHQEAQRAEALYRQQLFQNWTDQISKTDPDLDKKLPLIANRMSHLLQTEGDPGSPQAAWDRLNKAHQEITAEIKNFIPARQATAKTPQSTGPKVTKLSEPGSFDEALDQAVDNVVAGARGG